MERKRAIDLSYLSLVAAALFYLFFMSSKHIPLLSSVAPFLEDPYDAVGSFAALVAIFVACFNFARLALIERHQLNGRYLYIFRASLIVGLAIMTTIFTDFIAIVKTLPHDPMRTGELVLFSAMAILFLLSALILIENYSAIRNLRVYQNPESASEIDFLFRRKLLSPFNPREHPFRFSILFSLSISLLIAAIEIIGEGPAPTFQQTALVFIILTAIGTSGFFIILLLTGRYLGILGKQ